MLAHAPASLLVDAAEFRGAVGSVRLIHPIPTPPQTKGFEQDSLQRQVQRSYAAIEVPALALKTLVHATRGLRHPLEPHRMDSEHVFPFSYYLGEACSDDSGYYEGDDGFMAPSGEDQWSEAYLPNVYSCENAAPQEQELSVQTSQWLPTAHPDGYNGEARHLLRHERPPFSNIAWATVRRTIPEPPPEVHTPEITGYQTLYGENDQRLQYGETPYDPDHMQDAQSVYEQDTPFPQPHPFQQHYDHEGRFDSQIPGNQEEEQEHENNRRRRRRSRIWTLIEYCAGKTCRRMNNVNRNFRELGFWANERVS